MAFMFCVSYPDVRLCSLHPAWDYDLIEDVYTQMPQECKNKTKVVRLYNIDSIWNGWAWWGTGRIDIRSMTDWRTTIMHECQHMTEPDHIATIGVSLEYARSSDKFHQFKEGVIV